MAPYRLPAFRASCSSVFMTDTHLMRRCCLTGKLRDRSTYSLLLQLQGEKTAWPPVLTKESRPAGRRADARTVSLVRGMPLLELLLLCQVLQVIVRQPHTG